MTRYEHSGNAIPTTLTVAISNSATTINIADASGWPTGASYPFWVTIDPGTASEEKVLIASRSGTTLTVSSRGADSTSATSHSANAEIIHSFSATEADAANAHVEASAAVHGLTGTVVGTTDTQTLTNKTLTSPTVNSPTVTAGAFDTPIGRRNVVRNGDMGISQRGAGSWTSGSGYSLDGWRIFTVGGTYEIQRVVSPLGADSGQNGASAVLRAITAGQAGATNYSAIVQRIEGVRTLAGKAVTLSFLASATAGTPSIGVEVIQSFGTGGSPSADVNTAVQAVPISTTVTRYSVSFTVPSISGKTLGSGGDDYLELRFWFSAGTDFASRASSIGIQNATIDITDVQLEQGGLTAFERLSQADQEAWCQRYFYRATWTTGSHFLCMGFAYSTTAMFGVFVLPQPMRAVPTAAVVGQANFRVHNGSGGLITVTSGPAITGVSGTGRVALDAGCAGGLTAGQGSSIHMVGAGAYIEFLAEL